jgi:RNA polymerase sigma-70 factor (family 1)
MYEPSANKEKEILLRLKLGDQVAFNELYSQYQRKVYHGLKRLVHSPEVTAELHQDVFLKIWNRRGQLDADLPFEAFLISVAKNTAIDFYRKAARDKKLLDQLVHSMTEIYDPITALMERKDNHEILENAINKLPPQRQLVFRFIKLEHQSYENAAAHFGVSVGTIKDHMAKAMSFLKTEMTGSKSDLLLLGFVHLLSVFSKSTFRF